ncbi:DEAD/DEAH box helicase [Pseudogulbenkiania subflava]|uniref:Superfamily II DNA or RNA helicase, SNF2 family n=1 Tax=Pseudogulbenkiania subflava DSM 22618 TaxID=1123014 RepID=A0A1Y6BU55_9NEIS|nr:DEAD/DEAH box helicase [Pseudogulbenkiania subflava]SMF28954.1 Superfamily II DNA or RNA helicase, SNF2 family [Pseudogulbenkiania subflava DSM 22618]
MTDSFSHHIEPALTPAHQALLAVLALLPGGETKANLLTLLHRADIHDTHGKALDSVRLGTLLAELENRQWIVRNPGLPYRLVPAARTAALLPLLQDRCELARWSKLLPEHLGSRQANWGAADPAQCQLQLWLAVLAGQARPAQRWLTQLHELQQRSGQTPPAPAKRLFADAAGRALFDGLADDVQVTLLLDYLPEACWRFDGFRHGYDYALSRWDSGYSEWDELAEWLLRQALWRGDGERVALFGRLGNSLGGALSALLLQGSYGAALAHLDAWRDERKAETRQRKLDLPAELHALYCLALLGAADPARQAELKQAIQHGIKHNLGQSYGLLQHLVALQEGVAVPAYLGLPEQIHLAGLDGLMLALALYWLDARQATSTAWQATLHAFCERMQQEGYQRVVEELEALLERQFGEPRANPIWHSRHGARPLLELYQRREAWQHALSALSSLAPGKAAEARQAAPNPTRLAWFVSAGRHGVLLEPREQKLGAKGQWSKGRAVALKRLLDEADSADYLLEQDRNVMRHIQRSYDGYYGGSSYELDGEKALPALVGHPALFWADAPDVRIDVAAGQVALQLKESGAHIQLKLTPARVGADSEVVWEKDTPTRLVVYPVSKEIRQIAAIVGKELTVPLAAKAQLMEAITSIAPLVPIHSDLPELAAHIDTVPADARLYAHLLPLEQGLRLQLLMRPLPGGAWCKPGQGLENLVGEVDGKTLQTRRDLEQEKQAMQALLDACPTLAQADGDGQEWQLAEPQAALEVLSELQAVDPATLECVWPEGERMRIKARRGLAQMTFGLQKQGDWFVLSGDLELDDGRVLQLRQLLELLQANPGRFLKLGEQDWLALTDAMRRRLDELALLADHVGKDGGIRLSALTAPLLAELEREAGQFEADAAWREQLAALASLSDYQPTPPSTLQAELRDYQLEGYTWLSRLARWGVGACLADDMGLGKTVQTLALLLERAPAGPQLVVAPTSVALNWLAEAARFAPTLKVRPYQQQRALDTLAPFDLVVTSYGLLQQDADAFAAVPWTSVVLDEAQAIKNAGTKRAQAVLGLQAGFKLAASGTPVENHLGELWSLFRFLNPGLLGSQERFNQRFAVPVERGDKNARKALKALIQPFILRRTKSQVLDELPPRTEITFKVALSGDELHLYEALRQQAVDKLDALGEDDNKPLKVLAEITRLRRFCCHPRLALPDSELAGSKLKAFAEIAGELLDNRHKALVFSQFVDHLAIVRGWLDERGIAYQYLDGSTPARERKVRVDAFQAGQGDLFLISLKAGGTGLNLTAADYVIHLDPWWNPAVEDQASDRAHRMGQQRPVTVYRLVAEHTIEEQIVALHAAKRDLADSLLEGGEISAKLDADALLQLLKGS